MARGWTLGHRHLDRRHRRHRPGRRGLGHRRRHRPDGPRRAADPADPPRSSTRPALGWPTSSRSSSGSDRGRSPGCGSASSRAQVLAPVLGLRPARRLQPGRHRPPSTRPRARAEFVVATDARRREVYWARYGADGAGSAGPEVGSPGRVPGLPTVGPGRRPVRRPARAVPGPRVLDPGVLAAAGPSLPDAGHRAALPAPARRGRTRPPQVACCGYRRPDAPMSPLDASPRPEFSLLPARLDDLPAILRLEARGLRPSEQWSERSWPASCSARAGRC